MLTKNMFDSVLMDFQNALAKFQKRKPRSAQTFAQVYGEEHLNSAQSLKSFRFKTYTFLDLLLTLHVREQSFHLHHSSQVVNHFISRSRI